MSVILPARDAEESIGKALDSVLAQDYNGSVEVIVADGSDNTATSDLVRRLYPTVTLIPNPQRVIGYGIQAALRVATGEIVARCDAHTTWPPGYLHRAVETLQRTGAANVGGRQRPVGTTFFERAVALAMTTPLGTGPVRYRLGGLEGPVETVYLGVYRRDRLAAVGSYAPDMVRGEDYDLNTRLRMHGETVWFDPELVVDYRPRGTLRDLVRQYFGNGRWKRVALLRQPTALLPRHGGGLLLPRHGAGPLLLLGLAASAVLFWAGAPGAAALPLTYVVTLALVCTVRNT